MYGWWYDPQCSSPDYAACTYVSPSAASQHYLDSHIMATEHAFIRMVAR